jgi:hypothetical protein
MDRELEPAGAVRFGEFEVNFRERELRRQGLKIKINERPFQALSLLVERAGQVVRREEFQQRVWPTATNVAFDANLNTTITTLRRAERFLREPCFHQNDPEAGISIYRACYSDQQWGMWVPSNCRSVPDRIFKASEQAHDGTSKTNLYPTVRCDPKSAADYRRGGRLPCICSPLGPFGREQNAASQSRDSSSAIREFECGFDSRRAERRHDLRDNHSSGTRFS